MKITKVIVLLLTMSMMFFMFGCGDDDDEVNEFEVLTEYLEGTDGGYFNNMGTFYVKYADIVTADYFVLDLRAADDYAADHIENAYNATLGTMFDVIETNNSDSKTVLTVCYSGQTASFAQYLLNIKNISAKLLLFGMSSVRVENDVWTVMCSEEYAGDLIYTSSSDLPTFDYPELSTGYETGEEILDARIDAAIVAWGEGLLIAAGDVINNTSAYNIMNYWGTTDAYHDGNPYETLGHIDGAYQLIPGTVKTDGDLSAFDPVGTNVFYCWTGQTAAAACAYLTILGYDVKSIKYGFNTMNWSALNGHKWPKPY